MFRKEHRLCSKDRVWSFKMSRDTEEFLFDVVRHKNGLYLKLWNSDCVLKLDRTTSVLLVTVRYSKNIGPEESYKIGDSRESGQTGDKA